MGEDLGRKFIKIKEAATKVFFDTREYALNLITDVIPDTAPLMVREAFAKAVSYNAFGGKCVRGLSTVIDFLILAVEPSYEDVRTSAIFGWLIEYLQALFLMLDDIMDESETRRGKKCYYKLENIGLIGINDAFLIEKNLLLLAARLQPPHQRSFGCDIMKLFIEISQNTSVGQSIDMQLCACGSKPFSDVERFNNHHYEMMVLHKTTKYSFVLPFMVAYYLSGKDLGQAVADINQVLQDIGLLFQIQDDYLDVYGDPAITGKVGTDIQDGKCSWLAVQCLSLISTEDRELFQVNYGCREEAKIKLIKQLYLKYDLAGLYRRHVDVMIESIDRKIAASLPPLVGQHYRDYIESIRFRHK